MRKMRTVLILVVLPEEEWGWGGEIVVEAVVQKGTGIVQGWPCGGIDVEDVAGA